MTTKSISTLVPDILRLLEGEVSLSEEGVDEFAKSLHSLLVSRLTKSSDKPALRMSNFGTPCTRKLWYTVNTPEDAEPLSSQAKLKFLFGDILEELLLFLASEAGHEVEGQQDVMEIEGVKGHRDAVIDGVTVDVKSANARSYKSFAENNITRANPFHAGYIDQLNLYMEAGKDDPLVKEKSYGAFVAFDKERGGITTTYQRKEDKDYAKDIREKKEMLKQDTPPPRTYDDVPDGKSGNRKLQTVCSYCAFKDKCWPGHRTFLYSNGPRHLTVIKRVPDVFEKGK